VDELDDRRRAAFLASLAIGYRESGDMEAAIGLANQAIARYRELEADREIAVLENELALVHLALGATKRALAHATLAEERLVRLGDERGRAHVVETRAQIALAAGEAATAADLATEALALAETTGNRKAAASAGLTLGRARARGGDPTATIEAFEHAAALAREHGRVSQPREILTEWADLRAAQGDAPGAFLLSREALQLDARWSG
jgi:tetratricopeptide (TPR) repeat protein